MPRRRDAGPPRTGGGEKEVLLGFLDYLRASVIAKTDGIGEPRVRTPGVPSGTNLLGLVKHLTHVERHWLLGDTVRDWQATFHPGPDESVADIIRAYRETNARVNEVVADGDVAALRWTLTHLIEETGRHAGHADILRELIDGATGR
jgi:hypothetical protein